MNLYLIQMEVTHSVDENVAKALDLAKQALTEKPLSPNNPNSSSSSNSQTPKVVVFPEMFTTGFTHLATIAQRAHALDSPTIASFKKFAKNHYCYLVLGSVALKNHTQPTPSTTITNTTLIIEPKKGEIISRYDKQNLFPLMDETVHLTPGETSHLFHLGETPCSSIICYDLRFPQATLNIAKRGHFDILFIPVQWPRSRAKAFKILARARAIENKCFVVLVNRVGNDNVGHFAGGSLVINPEGDVLKELSDQEETSNIPLNLSK